MMKQLVVFLLSLSFLFCSPKTFSSTDEQLVERFLSRLDSLPLSTNERMVEAAKLFLDTPYVAAVLDREEEETLTINLQELDCVTLVENCMALTKASMDSVSGYDVFCGWLKTLRYRDSCVDGYASRLHYTTDWIRENERKGIVEDKTQAIGGHSFIPYIYYMSVHSDRYPKLKDNPSEVAKIKAVENEINAESRFYYIPKAEIQDKQSLIDSGDIICFTTSIAGLDVSHMGIAYRQDDRLTFIHASSKVQKVIVNPESLNDYCRQIKSNTGVIVLKLLK